MVSTLDFWGVLFADNSHGIVMALQPQECRKILKAMKEEKDSQALEMQEPCLNPVGWFKGKIRTTVAGGSIRHHRGMIEQESHRNPSPRTKKCCGRRVSAKVDPEDYINICPDNGCQIAIIEVYQFDILTILIFARHLPCNPRPQTPRRADLIPQRKPAHWRVREDLEKQIQQATDEQRRFEEEADSKARLRKGMHIAGGSALWHL